MNKPVEPHAATLTRDERHAAYMADGCARVSGRVGVCEGPSGGGATYLLPGLVEANGSSVPVLGINTDVSVSSRGVKSWKAEDPARLARCLNARGPLAPFVQERGADRA